LKNTLRRAVSALLAALMCASLLSGCAETPVELPMFEDAGNQIVINEVMSSNDVFWPAPDGRCYDWVEFRNMTDRTYDLSECYITDDERSPKKCRLTGVVLEPYGYAAVYLSGLDGVDIEGNFHASFKLSSMGETVYLNDPVGVIMSSLAIPESAPNISYGFPATSTDFSDSERVWFSHPTPGAENSSGYASDPSRLEYSTNGVVLNEYMTDNSFTVYDADGDYPDWVEIYNPTESDADMSGYLLSDDAAVTGKWRFPDGTVIPAGGYLTVFCSGKDKTDERGGVHTSFSLSSEDTAIVLSTAQGVLVSQTQIVSLPENVSCGRVQGSEEWKLFARSTPGKANSTAAFDLGTSPAPDINDGVLISETLASSSGGGEYKTDYIEIYNATSGAVDLGGYTLAQAPGEVVFTFPQMSLTAGGYLIVWCDGTTSADSSADLHAPIKLNVGGERLYLADATGKIVDYFDTGKQTYGVTSGRVGSDTSVRCFFSPPTPGAANSSSRYSGYAPQPELSLQAGYVQAGTQVSITVPEGCTVRYTTDGTEPRSGSRAYSPDSPLTISKTTVVRAAAFMDNALASESVCATYLVEEPHAIPVVSMNGAGLIDHETGIMVDGINQNYKRGWERDVHIEYIDENGVLAVEFNAGAEIFGQTSMVLDRKGVRLNISEKFGSSGVTYPFFKDSVSGVSTFKSLLLRPSGQDQRTSLIRDEAIPAMIRGCVEVDYMEVQPCALYVNGQYWGLYYVRERLDEDYLVSKYGFEKGKTDLVKSQSQAQAGSVKEYRALQAFAESNDLTKPENYEYMKSQIDFVSLCDFWIVETYFANTDTGNIRCYRTEGGKWRWMVYDFDWAMFPTVAKYDYIKNHCLDPDGHGAADFSNAIIRKLLENDEFRDLFISRYCYHLNTTFEPDRCVEIFDRMADTIRPEIPRNDGKWHSPKTKNWESSLEFIREFLRTKPEKAKQQLRSNFGLSEAELEEYLEKNK